jgi:uncharacterized alkaline shock family protein YloU
MTERGRPEPASEPEEPDSVEAVPVQGDEEVISFQEVPGLTDETGSVHISEEVLGTIAGIAAMEIEGVAGLSGGLVGDISEMLGKKSFARGVRVELGDGETTIDVNVIVDYGARIPRVAEHVQETVKGSIENMTELEVIEVNIHIQGVAFPSDEAQDVGT